MSHPKVFISYSHDTLEHKEWVIGIAKRLTECGIDVALDAWDIRLGGDISLFMDRGLREADRILMICTAPYVAKAEAGRGGVGYEKMIMTSEYIREIDSKRVIPIIRQKGEYQLPSFLSTKLYADFSNDDLFEQQFSQLVLELHDKPQHIKSELGSLPDFESIASSIVNTGNTPDRNPVCEKASSRSLSSITATRRNAIPRAADKESIEPWLFVAEATLLWASATQDQKEWLREVLSLVRGRFSNARLYSTKEGKHKSILVIGPSSKVGRRLVIRLGDKDLGPSGQLHLRVAMSQWRKIDSPNREALWIDPAKAPCADNIAQWLDALPSSATEGLA